MFKNVLDQKLFYKNMQNSEYKLNQICSDLCNNYN